MKDKYSNLHLVYFHLSCNMTFLSFLTLGENIIKLVKIISDLVTGKYKYFW